MNPGQKTALYYSACALWLTAMVCLPFFASAYAVRTAAGWMFFLILALCFNLLGGYSGYLNLGQGVFVGTGAYGYGLCVEAGMPWGAAVAVCLLAGFVFSLMLAPVLFRLRGEAFALVNLAFLYICLSLSHRLRTFTGGADGFFLSAGSQLPLALYGLTALAVLTTIAGGALPRFRLGYQVSALGQDVFLAESLGIDTLMVKVKLFAMCGAVLSAAGAFFMMGEGYIVPSTVFGLQTSLMPVAMAMVGGLGNPAGPFWGSLAVFGLQEWLWAYVGTMEQTLLGAMLILAGNRSRIKACLARAVGSLTEDRQLTF